MKTKWLAAFLALTCMATLVMAEDGVTSSRILIGQTVGVTGTVAGPVREANEGAAAYFNIVNQNGGIHGRKIELITLDDKFDPAITLANAETLIKKERVFALFQGRGTPHTQGILPLLATHNVPLVGPGTGSAVFHDPPHRQVFNVRAKYQVEVAKVVEHLNTIGINDIGLLHVDDSFGQDGLTGFTNAMAAHKLTPAFITKFPRVNPNFDATATPIVRANPRALIVISSAKNTAGVIKAIRAQGGQFLIMTLSNNSSQSFVQDLGSAGPGIIVSQITPAPHLISTLLGQEFAAAVKANGGVTISYAAMEGFVNAKVMAEGLRRAGRNLTREGFIRALESMKKVDLGGLTVDYSSTDHTGSEFVELTMIGKNGRFIR